MSSITKTTMTSTAAKGASGASGAAGAGRHYSFQPLNIGRILIWGAFALALIVAPLVFTSSLALTMLSRSAISSSSACPTTSCWGRAAC